MTNVIKFPKLPIVREQHDDHVVRRNLYWEFDPRQHNSHVWKWVEQQFILANEDIVRAFFLGEAHR